jgi:hypothetical protein
LTAKKEKGLFPALFFLKKFFLIVRRAPRP